MKVLKLKVLAAKITKAKSIEEVNAILWDSIHTDPDFCGGHWEKYSVKLLAYLTRLKIAKNDGQSIYDENPAFSVIALNGNSKLPFASFSTIAIYSCPGAGPCTSWCYSVKAWRYPAAYFRQLQNTILMRFFPSIVARSFENIPSNVTKLRLYVDGDFSSVSDVFFWFNLIKNRPSIQVYGYSKSWDEIHFVSQRISLPSNYVLNLSGGGRIRNTSREDMLSLPITRGEFLAVPLQSVKEKSTKRFSLPEYHAETRQAGMDATGRKVFSCPGQCGTCSSGSHACGSMQFKGIPIAIGIH